MTGANSISKEALLRVILEIPGERLTYPLVFERLKAEGKPNDWPLPKVKLRKPKNGTRAKANKVAIQNRRIVQMQKAAADPQFLADVADVQADFAHASGEAAPNDDQWVYEFAGSWNDFPETAEEMIAQIEGARTLGREVLDKHTVSASERERRVAILQKFRGGLEHHFSGYEPPKHEWYEQ